jgi:cytochrome c peroxidase
MTKSQKILLSLIIPSLLLILPSLKRNSNPENIISDRYTKRQIEFIKAINDFRISLKARNEEQLKAEYSKMRKTFKKWEYLAEYKNPILFKDKINGAPLPKLEENASGAIIIEPVGLQVIDEIMGNVNVDSNFVTLDYLSKNLLDNVRQIPDNPMCYDHEIFEAGRMELIRLYTLGLTGFDAPGTLQSLEDAENVLTTLREDFSLFMELTYPENDTQSNIILSAFNVGIKMLEEQKDFNRFDRARFLIKVINPLSSGLLGLQKSLNIPMPAEIRSTPSAINYNAEMLFSNNFLNPGFYSRIPDQFRTEDARILGQTLFFDPILSNNNQRACASCHKPELAFTDGLPKSKATDFQGTVSRNSPTLINCVFSERFFHDLRAEALEDQMDHVIADKKEFNTTQLAIIEKIGNSPEYLTLFKNAFPGYQNSIINAQTISFAISSYVGSLNSFNSAFDLYARGESKEIDAAILKGFNLFMGKAACGTCHFAPLFSGTVPPDYSESESEVLGVPVQWPAKKPAADLDLGRAAGRLKEQVDIYRYSFKTPTIRNIQKTAPYMHNGGMKTLESVMNFYNNGGGNGIGLNFEHQTLSSDKLNLSKTEIKQIIAFMNSLTDYKSLATKPKKLPKFNDSSLDARIIGGLY